MEEFSNELLDGVFAKLDRALEEPVTFSEGEIELLKFGLEQKIEQGQGRVEPLSDTSSGCLDKINILNSESTGNHCYLKLLATMPNFKKVDTGRLLHVCRQMKRRLSTKPLSLDVIGNLTVASDAMVNVDGEVSEVGMVGFESARQHLHTLEQLMESATRFSYSEVSGVIHLDFATPYICDHKEVLCDHGWSSRFVLCMLTTKDTRVGSDLDLSALFGPEPTQGRHTDQGITTGWKQTGSQQKHHAFGGCALSDITEQDELTQVYMDAAHEWIGGQGVSGRVPSAVRASNMSEKEPATPGVDDFIESLKADQLKGLKREGKKKFRKVKREGETSEDIEESLRKIEDIFSSKLDRLTEKLAEVEANREARGRSTMREAGGEAADDDVASTIMPNDSSTQILRYESTRGRRFLNEGSVFVVGKDGTTIEGWESGCEMKSGEQTGAEGKVVLGFVKTKNMSLVEGNVNSTVHPINGLANPFRSNRLNFLMHFHTACEYLSSSREDTPYVIVEKMSRMSSRTPTEELVKQVVCKTFDFGRLTIVANPFLLPHIEIGMMMSDQCLTICFDLLRSEYKMLWFTELKGLVVPDFHKNYRSYRETKLTGSHRDRAAQRVQSFMTPGNDEPGRTKKGKRSLLSVK